MDKNTEAQVGSTQMDDSTATDSRTEEQMLADIVRNSAFTEGEESLPSEQIPEGDTDETTEEDPEVEESETEEVEEEVETEDEETEAEDEENSTEAADVYSQEELDLDAQVVVKIDGKESAVSFSDLIKGYSTEQSLSNKGRELGDARKQLDEEYGKKFSELKTVADASSAILYSSEKQLATKYHEIDSQIDEARKSGDNYNLEDLKDQREQVQKEYWKARNSRENFVKDIEKNSKEQQEKEFNENLKIFSEEIPKLIPDFNEKTAKAIREFALSEGIKSETLDAVVDPNIVKFVDDYRRLKQGISKGTAKRKNTTIRKAPIKRAKTKTQKEVSEKARLRERALSEDSTNEEQMAFLRGLAEQSLGNN